jgi:hypothetical protein
VQSGKGVAERGEEEREANVKIQNSKKEKRKK